MDQPVVTAGNALLDQKGLLAAAVLRKEEHLGMRPNRQAGSQCFPGSCRHVFKLKGHHRQPRCCLGKKPQIVIAANMQPVGMPCGRAIGHVTDDRHAVAHPPCRDGEHRPQLATPKHAQSGPG